MNNIQYNIMMSFLFVMLCLTGCSSPQILEKAEAEMVVLSDNSLMESAAELESISEAEEISKNQETADVSDSAESTSDSNNEAAGDLPDIEQDKAVCYVHISGAVKYPGVYQMEPQARLYEAVMKAGGFTDTASEDYCNLAQTVADGVKYYFPTKEEVKEMVGSENGLYLAKETASGDYDGLESQKKSASEEAEILENSCYDNEGRLDINKAGVAELTLLQGIGNSRAEAILAYRQEHGPFQSTEDLMKVSGIKEGTYHQLKDKIVAR